MMIAFVDYMHHLTIDDYVGMLPFFALVGFLLYGIGQGISFCFSIIKKGECTEDQNDQEEKSGEATQSNLKQQTILFLLLLSYLLSPLNTMIHLRGKRWNRELYRNGTSPGLFDLIHGTDPQLQQLMTLMPSLQRGPKPPLLFGNRHLQFIPWLIQNELHRQEGIAYQRIEVEIKACLDKSKGLCEKSPYMKDTIMLDVFPPFDEDENSATTTTKKSALNNSAPIIFFAPGLRCTGQDLPGTMIVRRAYGAGFRSVVVNRRGHAAPLQAPRWNLFGDVDELEEVYWHIANNYAAKHTPFFLHGISSGTGLVVTALSQWDERRLQGDSTAPSFVGSVSLTPGYDISHVLAPHRFKAPYNSLLTQNVKDHFILGNEAILRQFDGAAVDKALAATHLQELLEASTPFAGYPNVTSYYKAVNPVNGMHHITTPKLVLNSIDDPCCNVHNIYEQSPYPQHQGRNYAQLVADSKRLLLAVTESGSHCPFLDVGLKDNLVLPALLPAIVTDPYNGGWMLDSWADRISIEFYQAALAVYGEERRHMQ